VYVRKREWFACVCDEGEVCVCVSAQKRGVRFPEPTLLDLSCSFFFRRAFHACARTHTHVALVSAQVDAKPKIGPNGVQKQQNTAQHNSPTSLSLSRSPSFVLTFSFPFLLFAPIFIPPPNYNRIYVGELEKKQKKTIDKK